MCRSEPAFGSYGLLFCMKTVAKLIKEVSVGVIVGLLTHKYAENSAQKIAHYMQKIAHA